ncbi:hypothetical protein DWB77_02453 [Streptomyces hundungensis]|uniref:Tetracycline repressor TetR C-terminal domain-containing protein n=1 Tax=Streptomyces hundungensis TaxID=1077946 RepID=A0A387HHP5_9ACTN|nr:hypothetical protein [Streptomyces hundungensis]AYG80322.1 hypothetical protein DWB77_02453 [Streptomyces hundungensis]
MPTPGIHGRQGDALLRTAFVQGLGTPRKPAAHTLDDPGVSNAPRAARDGGRFAAIVSDGQHPALTTVFEHERFEPNSNPVFGFGLDRLLDGIAASLHETSA